MKKIDIRSKIFRKNFHDGWEREGAAVCIYYKGELVVDLYGGYSDASSLRPWTAHTRTVVFSATKAVGALCIAVLIDRGYLRYTDRVSQFWPEFGQNGKENITVGWVMNHSAGLAAFDEPISKHDACDHQKIADIISRQKPNWIPGTKVGYHAITYGWLVDQIVRRVDPKHRSIGTFFKQEIAEKFAEEYTVSRLTSPPFSHKLKEIAHDPRILYVLCMLYIRPPTSIEMLSFCSTMKNYLQKVNTFNDPDLHQMEQVAALGITKAKDLARLFSLFIEGEIVSKNLINLYKMPEISRAPLPKGYGFMYERHPFKPGCWLVGHAGLGGSTIMMDIEENLVIAYVSNGLKLGTGELTRTYRLLRNAAFLSIK
ncbi:unnamed protein product [Thelazia callipaeda]|uniref:Beta-lactamase domain-containing protein n=1 Tax=Thelazia callipaeda TaxID=103827 RepID=A0A0N5CW82_THECL|nr:unnamed protein product [Thelazia callipaeda]